MTRYLLDTTVLIDFSKGREPSRSTIPSMIEQGDELGVCAVNVAEFYSGLLPGSDPDSDAFISALGFWEITRESAVRAGSDRFDHSRRGTHLSVADALIAATARGHDAVLLTGNPRHSPQTDVQIRTL
jgi:predicted nucleic acid-binding protein